MVVMGIDAGGSKTHAVLSDEQGHILGWGRSGCANWEAAGLKGAGQALQEATQEALSRAGLSGRDIEASAYGLAGLDWPSDEVRLTPVVEGLGLTGARVLVNDAFLPLRAGIENGVGLAAIAGSGATVVGRNAEGRTSRSFGAGYPFPDWGGAWDIALEAVHAVAKACRFMSSPTDLTRRMLTFCQCQDVMVMMERIMREEVKITGAFAPQVLDAAEQGDEVARKIVQKAGRTIADNALSVAQELGMRDSGFVLVVAGGVFSSQSAILKQSLADRVRSQGSKVELRSLHAPPVMGAVLLAMDQLHIKPEIGLDSLAQIMSRSLKI